MNNIYTDMENLLAQVIQYMNTDKLLTGFPSLYMLFDISEDSCVSFHSDQAPAKGIMNIYKELLRIERQVLLTDDKHAFFTAAPVYITDPKQCGSCDGIISCDLFDYHRCRMDGKEACLLHARRLEIGFVYRNRMLKIKKFCTETIQTYEPWFYTEAYPTEQAYEVFDSIGPVDAADYIALKRLHNYLWDHLLETDENGNPAEAGILRQIMTNASLMEEQYPLVGITGSLCADVDKDGGRARCYQMAEVFRIVGKASDMKMVRSFWQILTESTHSGGVWKISSIAAQPVMYLPLASYVPGIRYDRWSMGKKSWDLINTPMPGGDPKDLYEIENIMGAWAYRGRRAELSVFAGQYMTHPGLTPVLAIMSRGKDTPVAEGIDAIRERFAGMEARFKNHRYSMHVPTTPVVEISADGMHAIGTWYDHSQTCLASGDETRFPYMVFVARYFHEFVKLDQKWYVKRFYWEPMLHLQEWELDLTKTDGWAAREDDRNYPKPLELLEPEA